MRESGMFHSSRGRVLPWVRTGFGVVYWSLAGKLGRYPQFARCIAPGPSSHSLTRSKPPIRLPDAPLNVPPQHAVLSKGQFPYRHPREGPLRSRK